jgi:pimeloyl-ACP methyl ester carboxylesterase
MKTLLIALTLSGALLAEAPFQAKVTGHGRPMILIPGLNCPGDVWDGTVAHYKENYELHVLSLAGFAGVPRVPGPFLATMRDGIAQYIREQKLDHPIVVGHSLGGYLALDLAAHYPDLPGRLIIVDSYPMLAGVADPDMTTDKARQTGAQMRTMLERQSQDTYDRVTKSGIQTRAMVTKDSDLERVIGWSLKSDRSASIDALCELYSADLRDDVAKIKTPTLVMGAWIGYKEYGVTHEAVDANLHAQYSKLSGAQIAITDTARHFIMWDDPSWMFAQMDGFLTPAKAATAK